MTSIKKEIKKMVTIYIAIDGEEFEDEEECYEYETNLRLQQLHMYNAYFEKTDDISRCFFVVLRTPEEVKTFLELNYNFGCDGVDEIDKPDKYYYDSALNKYRSYTDTIKLIKQLDSLE